MALVGGRHTGQTRAEHHDESTCTALATSSRSNQIGMIRLILLTLAGG